MNISYNNSTAKYNPVRKKKSLFYNIWKNKDAYFFLLPIFAVMGIFKYYPAFNAFIKSLYNWNGVNISEFIGIKNFSDMWKDTTFITSLKNVSYIALANIIKIITMPLIAAELVFCLTSKKLKETYKLLFVIPMVVPGIVVSLMWRWIYQPSSGVLNQLLTIVGLGKYTHAWLGESATALWSVIILGFPWVGGIPFLIYLGGLQAIPEELFEASKIDGIGWFKRVMHIDIPLISGQIRLLIIMTIVSSLESFENIIVLTNGGPGDCTMVPALHLYQQGLTYSRMGYSSAIGVFMFFIVLILTIISFKIGRSNNSMN